MALFQGPGISDKDYHKKYPTIHHLIVELMTSEEPHDSRLVFWACAWLLAHRGHFLLDVTAENLEDIVNFERVYQDFLTYLEDEGYKLPWDEDKAEILLSIMQMDAGVNEKKKTFKQELFGGKKISKEIWGDGEDGPKDFPCRVDLLISLLAGGTEKPAALYGREEYAELKSICLTMDDEEFASRVAELGEDGELMLKLRALSDCAQLSARLGNAESISAAKVKIYEQHKKDLKTVKRLVKKYCPKKYDEIFRELAADNYMAYTGQIKGLSEERKKDFKAANKEAFSDFLKKRLKGLPVEPADQKDYKEDMMERLEQQSFLPKQKDGDNRLIPQQLYRYELGQILQRAQKYLPLLKEKDADGLTVKDKILSIFDFKIPYYVGPLREKGGPNIWLVRKAQGKILPWNFDQLVDHEASEREFIKRLTNTCTYLPGEKVLPKNSLLYSKFEVLNELNMLKVNGQAIEPAVKQAIYRDLYQNYSRVTSKKIKDYLLQRGLMEKDDIIPGLDTDIKSSLKSYHIFKKLLANKILSEKEVEEIIEQAAYTEDKGRLRKWLKEHYKKLSDEDVTYISRQNLKQFGRLSARLLAGILSPVKGFPGELTIIEALWETNENLMGLLSPDRYAFYEQIKKIEDDYYKAHPQKLHDRLASMYIPNSVKRPIMRTLDIVRDLLKATGKAPEKIFVEMARGASSDQKGKRTQSRKKQLEEFYKKIKTKEVRELAKELAKELESYGDQADNRLQSNKLFLYYLQLGKCAYTGNPIKLERLLAGDSYNLDHIYPQCHVKDDSVLNNLVLVESTANARKGDSYPLAGGIREKMRPFWDQLKNNKLMTEEKHRRLTRVTPFTEDEKQGFINRQLVETRQSSKAITSLLKERFPQTEIIYVKAALISEFRRGFNLPKSRAVNDLHHAKDAYLNIVVGNVYHERFTKKWFRPHSDYNIQVEKLFSRAQSHGEQLYWNGESDIAKVKKTMSKNAVHLTRYAFCRHGQFFDQQPLKKNPDLIPLKKGLPPEKYGGYNKPTASFFVLAAFKLKKKKEVMLVPIKLLEAEAFRQDPQFARSVTQESIREIIGQEPQDLELKLQGRPLKINTVFSLDGLIVSLAGKSSGGKAVLLLPLQALKLEQNWEAYVKKLESFAAKKKLNKDITLAEKYDHITKVDNEKLYELLTSKMSNRPFELLPANQAETLNKGKEKFQALPPESQVSCLLNIISLFGAGASRGVDLAAVGGTGRSGSTTLSSSLSNWAKKYKDVRVIDSSASGLFETRSENLLSWL